MLPALKPCLRLLFISCEVRTKNLGKKSRRPGEREVRREGDGEISPSPRAALPVEAPSSLPAYFHTGQRLCRSLASPQTWSCRPSLTSATQLSAGHRRWLSQSTAAEEESKIGDAPRSGGQTGQEEKADIVVYHGPVSTTIRKVKLLSLSSCFFSVMLGPVITFMTLPNMSMILKGVMASSVLLISASTTAALHWVVSPYIHKMKWQPGSDTFEVEMMSWLATYVPRTIKFSDIRPPETNRPVVTFKANGKFYYVDEEHCHDKALLARLTPTETSGS